MNLNKLKRIPFVQVISLITTKKELEINNRNVSGKPKENKIRKCFELNVVYCILEFEGCL